MLLYFLRSEEGEKALKSVSIAVWLANLKKKDTQAPSYNKTGMITGLEKVEASNR